ncbi:MAG: phosphate regulon sensor histidine kinase PhoR [Steroidobacteraceae bacterium]
MQHSIQAWGRTAAKLAGAIVLGVIVGFMLGHVLAGLCLVFGALLAWQLFNLFRLDYWLRARSTRDPPDVDGIWGDVITNVVRLHRRKRYHKQRLLRVFREIRQSTAAMPDGVVVLNGQHEILWFNRTAQRLIGLKRNADLRIRITNLVRDPEFARYLHTDDFTDPVMIAPAVGSDVYLSFQMVPYGGDQLLMLVRDVTRQARLESMRKDFVANASHELRSPLTVIAGYVETLGSDPTLDPELRPPLEEMRRQAERMTLIIHDLLELSKLDESDEELAGEPIDVPTLLAMLRKDLLSRASHPLVSLRLDSDALLLGDELEIHSAFSNLVDNAAKYTPAGGSIEIRWFSDSEGGHFSVADTGIGIPAEHIPRLTERFYRVDPGRSRATGGSGLGLAIVKHVMQHHGATLTITSVDGKGSTFMCSFPTTRLLRPRAVASLGS